MPKHPAKRRAYGSGSVVYHAHRAKSYEARPSIKDAQGTKLPSRYFATAAEAHAHLDDLCAAVRLHVLDVRQRVRFDRYARAWLSDIEQSTLKPATKDAYRKWIGRVLVPELGAATFLDTLTVDQVRGLEARLSRTLARNSVKQALNVLSGILAMAVADEMLSKNVVQLMRTSRRKRHQAAPAARRDVPWSQMQIVTFRDRAAQHSASALWLLMADRGLRVGEAQALTWQDVDLDRNLLYVRHTIYYRSAQQYQRVSTKSAAGTRTLPLSGLLREALIELQATHGHTAPDDAVIAWPDGTVVCAVTIRRWLTALCVAADIPRVTPHQLRHLAVSRMADAGISVDVRKVAFGHTTAAMNEHYTHVLDTRVVEAFAAVDARD